MGQVEREKCKLKLRGQSTFQASACTCCPAQWQPGALTFWSKSPWEKWNHFPGDKFQTIPQFDKKFPGPVWNTHLTLLHVSARVKVNRWGAFDQNSRDSTLLCFAAAVMQCLPKLCYLFLLLFPSLFLACVSVTFLHTAVSGLARINQLYIICYHFHISIQHPGWLKQWWCTTSQLQIYKIWVLITLASYANVLFGLKMFNFAGFNLLLVQTLSQVPFPIRTPILLD